MLWYFDKRFKYFYCLKFIPQYSLYLAPKKPREAKIWAEIAEYMSIQDQTIVDERELLEEHQFLLDLKPVRPSLSPYFNRHIYILTRYPMLFF